ncbi:hypothetical protein BDN70DRAFT_920833 [Pholiota conissans]|uniref:Cleavage stimulation factor subunit 2 hinge domain-containing protein n=1 Tax=Pholiota conissans TaxID=109636 RepID=A0A9P5Z2S4_9AGAR|nr:hypothetical protein BDN70DRAFT_920833 [Pholiota conissans]
MANPTIATEQLLELLLTLKKTTPEAARSILNNQPTIAYALMTLMVSMNAVNIEVFQKTLAEFGATNAPDASSVARPASAATSAAPPSAPAPISAIPSHLQNQYRTVTPPSSASSSTAPPPPQAPTHTPTPPYGYSATPNGAGYAAQGYGYQQGYQQQQTGYAQYQQYQQQQAGGYPGYPGYGQPAATPAAPTPALPDSLSGISDEQKALIMRVLAMTPEQINMLPPADRATYIQIRTTLGVPT